MQCHGEIDSPSEFLQFVHGFLDKPGSMDYKTADSDSNNAINNEQQAR